MSVITIDTLFRFGTFIFPLEFIKLDTYKVKPRQRQDLDAYTDANGLTHRNGLDHYKTEITFTTRPLHGRQFDVLMTGITSQYSNQNERDAENCAYWDPEILGMRTGVHLYLDPSLEIPLGQIIVDASHSYQGPAGIHMISSYDGGYYTQNTTHKGGELRGVKEINWMFIEY